jgi:protein gp37
MNATKIEYLNFTWSPMVGCSRKNCAVAAKCWAMYQAKRQLHNCQLCYEFKPHTHFERLKQPFQILSSKRIGVTFSADFWDEGFTIQERKQVFSTAIEAKQHWFINLTKQPQNIPTDLAFPKNWIQGVSVNRKADIDRIDLLLKTQAPLKMISFEPIYEDIAQDGLFMDGIDWVILGAQTHPLKSPKPEWIQNLIDSATFGANRIPIFMKNNLNPYDEWKDYPSTISGKETK